jgi:hypothetical protein
MGVSEGETSRGIFANSAPRYGGRRLNWARRHMGALDRFAEQLSRHIDQADLDAGRNLATGEPLPAGAELDPGGNCKLAATRSGAKESQGNAMLQRIRQRLGPQAR